METNQWLMQLRRPYISAPCAALVALLTGLLLVGAASASPQDDLRQADQRVEIAVAAIDRGDVADARAEYAAFEAAWGQIEDGIRDTDRGAYRAIEGAM